LIDRLLKGTRKNLLSWYSLDPNETTQNDLFRSFVSPTVIGKKQSPVKVANFTVEKEKSNE
jgi:hypothetical protein